MKAQYNATNKKSWPCDEKNSINRVSGGSAAKFLCNGLPLLQTDWSKWHVFFCDERHVPFSDNECTYKFYKENLMSKVPLSEDHVYPDNPDVSGKNVICSINHVTFITVLYIYMKSALQSATLFLIVMLSRERQHLVFKLRN